MTTALALGLAVLIGLALGLFGGGGSILSVPLLTYVVGLPPKNAIATSLLVIGVASGVTLLAHARSGLVAWRTGLLFGATGMVGAYAGGRLASLIPGTILIAGFGLTMLATAIAMLRQQGSTTEQAPLPGSPASRRARIALHGLLVGAVTGMIGAGGGFLIVPALVLLGRMPMRRAVATSLLVITMKSMAGFVGYLGHVPVVWEVALPIAAFAAAGSVAGGFLVKRAPQKLLRKGFAWLVLGAGVAVLGHELSALVPAGLYQALLVERWPWWLGAVALAAVVVGFAFTDNKLLGVATGLREVCQLGRSPAARSSWRPHFLVGIVLGGAAAGLLAGTSPSFAMGSLDAITQGSLALKLVVLFAAGTLIGVGSRWAGGCTSGHGIVGTALGARSSFLATALFMVSGFAATHLLLAL